MKLPSNIGCRTKEFFANLKCPNCFSKKVTPCENKAEEKATCDFKVSTPYELEDGQTVRVLIQLARIDTKDVKILFVNNRVGGLDTVLFEGDRVGLTPTLSALKDPYSCINKTKLVNCGDW